MLQSLFLLSKARVPAAARSTKVGSEFSSPAAIVNVTSVLVRSKFVDHEKLLTLVAQRVADGRVLRLIQAMLKAGSYYLQGSEPEQACLELSSCPHTQP